MRNDTRNNPDGNRDERRYDDDAHWLHGHHHGQNSDRGNYTIDSHFNRGYRSNEYGSLGENANIRSSREANEDYRYSDDLPGGARYSGEDFNKGNAASDNMYGMTFRPNDSYNSGRHYDPRADYSDSDYDSLRRSSGTSNMARRDEQFGHDMRPSNDDNNWARGSRSDYESYRRHERGNDNYDNDYRSGYAGRNERSGRSRENEMRNYGETDRWQGRGDEQYERYIRERDRR